MELGWLELVLLILSTSTFVFALVLLVWVAMKGGLQACIGEDEKKKSYPVYKQPYRTTAYSKTKVTESPATSAPVTSPDESTISETTKQHILSSHPHFWDNLEDTTAPRKQVSYGSILREKAVTTEESVQTTPRNSYSSTEDSFEPGHFTYARLRLQFQQFLSSAGEAVYQLLSVQSLHIGFSLRDVYLELKCHVSSQKSLDVENVHEIIQSEKKKRGLLKSFGSTKQVTTKRQNSGDGEFQFDLPVSKMRHKCNANKTLIFMCDETVATSKDEVTSTKPKIEASCFIKRGKDKVYLGKAEVCDGSFSDEKDDKGSDLFDMIVDFVHDPKIILGKATVCMTYLPTAEKLSVEIKEYTLDKPATKINSDIAELHWRVTMAKRNKRRSRRKIPASYDQNTSHWSCDKVVTFDRVTPDIITHSSLILKLVGKVHKDSINGQIKMSENIMKSNGRVISREAELDDSDADVHRSGSTYEVVLGEIFIGHKVPDSAGREHWLQVLQNTRMTIQKQHNII